MGLSREQILEFANLTQSEFDTLDTMSRKLALKPSTKISLQTNAMDLDELADQILDIILSLRRQLSYAKFDSDELYAKYFGRKISVFKDKEIYYKLLEENNEESKKYKDSKIKVEMLEALIQTLADKIWQLKSRRETYRMNHATDY